MRSHWKINQDEYESAKKKESTKKLTFKKAIVVFVVAALFSLALHLGGTVKNVLDKEWRKQGYGYPVKMEFLVSQYLTGQRSKLIENGWDTEGAFLSFLEKIHKAVYTKMLGKIPQDAGERDLLYFNYRIYPLTKLNSGLYADNLIPDIIRVFDNLIQNPIKSTLSREKERFNVARLIINYFVLNTKYTTISTVQIKDWEDRLITGNAMLLNEIDIDFIVSQPRYNMTAIRYFESFIYLYYQRIKVPTYTCSLSDFNSFLELREAYSKSLDIYEYHKILPNYRSEFNKIKKNSQNRIDHINGVFKKLCKY